MKRGIKILFYGLLFIFSGLGLMGMADAKINHHKALIIVDPGMSGFSLRVAQNISGKLNDKGIEVKLVKSKEFDPGDLTKVDLLVIGGPTYAHKPSKSIKEVIAQLNKPGISTLLFQTGCVGCEGLEPLADLVSEKKLRVLNRQGILANKRDELYVENKISELLENL